MATRACPNCGEQIQRAAKLCRFCRKDVQPLEEISGKAAIWTALIVACVIFGVYELVEHSDIEQGMAPGSAKVNAPHWPPPPPPAPPATPVPAAPGPAGDTSTNLIGYPLQLVLLAAMSQHLTFGQISKNTEQWKTHAWSFTGEILEIGEDDDGTMARVGLDRFGNNAVMVAAKFRTDFTKGDVVDVAGFLAGSYNYTSQAGWNITIPALFARSIQKRGTFERLLHPHGRRETDDAE